MRSMRSIAVATTLLLLAIVRGATAVEVRRGALPAYTAHLAQAYAACLTPNAVTDQGQPACYPAVTSVCRASGDLTVDGGVVTLDVRRPIGPTATAFCKAGPYRLDVMIRPTFDEELSEPACNADVCTRQDVTVSSQPFDLETTSRQIVSGLFADGIGNSANYEIRGATLIGPDDLPIAAAGATGRVDQPAVQTLSVGYEPCLDPAPGFDSCPASWTSPCDFEFGSITPRVGIPSFTTTLHKLAGSSPACTSGTYQLEARARLTVEACGPSDAEDRACTLPDADYVMPLPVNGPELERSTSLGGANGPILTAEVRGLRVIDPTGALIAAVGSTTAPALGATKITMKEDRLQIRTVFPFEPAFDPIDPTDDDGVTVTLHDKDGGIYAVTIPGAVWQLQPPLGERWELRDPGGANGGVRKARVKLLRKKGAPVGYDVRVDARGVDLSAADLASVTLTIAIARREPVVIEGPKTASLNRFCQTRGVKQCR